MLHDVLGYYVAVVKMKGLDIAFLRPNINPHRNFPFLFSRHQNAQPGSDTITWSLDDRPAMRRNETRRISSTDPLLVLNITHDLQARAYVNFKFARSPR